MSSAGHDGISPDESLLRCLFPDPGLIQVSTKHPRNGAWKHEFHNSVGKALAAIRSIDGLDIYFGVASRQRHRGRKEDLLYAAALWADLDHQKRMLVESFPLPPSAIVDSGRGFHLYWFLAEPFYPDPSKPIRAELEPLEGRMLGISGALEGDSSGRDANQLLRVPGTLNLKYLPARPVRLLCLDPNRRYRLEQFDGYYVKSGPTVDMEFADVELDGEQVLNQYREQLHPRALRAIETGEATNGDRSRRDFFVVCCLRWLGAAREEVQAIYQAFPVGDKYKQRGDQYLLTTIANAEAKLAQQHPRHPHPGGPYEGAAVRRMNGILEALFNHPLTVQELSEMGRRRSIPTKASSLRQYLDIGEQMGIIHRFDQLTTGGRPAQRFVATRPTLVDANARGISALALKLEFIGRWRKRQCAT